MSIFNALTGIVVNTALLPIALVKDVITVGGPGNREPYTFSQGKDLLSSLEELEDEIKKLAKN
jgi:hypothetical protein